MNVVRCQHQVRKLDPVCRHDIQSGFTRDVQAVGTSSGIGAEDSSSSHNQVSIRTGAINVVSKSQTHRTKVDITARCQKKTLGSSRTLAEYINRCAAQGEVSARRDYQRPDLITINSQCAAAQRDRATADYLEKTRRIGPSVLVEKGVFEDHISAGVE